MADKKISEDPDVEEVDGTEIIPVVKEGNKKVTAKQIADLANEAPIEGGTY